MISFYSEEPTLFRVPYYDFLILYKSLKRVGSSGLRSGSGFRGWSFEVLATSFPRRLPGTLGP